MVILLSVLIAILILVIIFLSVKIYLMQKSADEINSALAERLRTDTNALIDISCRDRHMLKLAGDINNELRKLRKDRRKYHQGDMELKNAVTNISHDLRTPLTAICGYLDLLEKEEKSPEAERYLNIISERAQTLKQLTEELFRYSVISSTLDDARLEDVELSRALEDSICAHYALIKQNNIEPEIVLSDRKIVRRLDKNALLRVFQNIIGNAVKYSDGDLKITLSDNGEITFSNHAKGLDEVHIGRLFDRFYTVETADKSTGLGLSIAKVLTEHMGGTITAQYNNQILSIHINFSQTIVEPNSLK